MSNRQATNGARGFRSEEGDPHLEGRSTRRWTVVLPLLLLGLFPSIAAAQFAAVKVDFDGGTLTPLVNLGPPGASTVTPTFGGVMDISIVAGGGSTVVGDVSTFYQDTVSSVDLLDWTSATEPRISLLTLTQTMPPPTPVFDGYTLRLDLATEEFDLIRVASNVPTILANAPVTLDPAATDYRLVFSRSGNVVSGQLLDLKDLDNPVAALVFDDTGGLPSFAFGFPGISIAENPTTMNGASLTVDNFMAAPLPGSDGDADGWGDPDDNCMIKENGTAELSNQIDSDADGFGNACDPDWDGNGVVTTLDGSLFLNASNTSAGGLLDGADLEFDLDGDRALTLGDFAIYYRALVGLDPAPGP